MRHTVLLLALLFSATSSWAQEIGGLGDLNGEKVILLPDHTWRFDDAGGERCTPVKGTAEICALPSVWSPVPGDPGFEPQWFQQGKDFRAVLWVLGDAGLDPPMTVQIVKRFINSDRGKDSDFGLTVEDTKVQLAGKRPTTLASVIGTTSTRVYSFAFLGDGTVLLAVTVEDPSFTYSVAHKTVHAGFLAAIRVEAGK